MCRSQIVVFLRVAVDLAKVQKKRRSNPRLIAEKTQTLLGNNVEFQGVTLTSLESRVVRNISVSACTPVCRVVRVGCNCFYNFLTTPHGGVRAETHLNLTTLDSRPVRVTP